MKSIKNRMKPVIGLIAAAALLFGMSACSREDGKGDSTPTPTETVTVTAEPTPTPTREGVRPDSVYERNGDVVILFTSDVHCGVDQGFGYAGLQEIRKYLDMQGAEVILVDNGDNIQGEPLGTMTRGEALIDLMNDMGYRIAIPGNHEFDYGMKQFLSLAKRARFQYISCNFTYQGENVFDPYVIEESAGKKIAFVGVTTPKTLTTSTPSYFMDENGQYVYGFCQDATGEGVYNAVQKAVDDARAEGAEYVVVLAHLGNEEECSPWTYAEVIANTRGIDVLLDGHSHDTDQVMVKDKDGKTVIRAACGTKLEGIGWCRIKADGTVTAGLYSWDNSVPAPDLLGINNEMKKAVSQASDVLKKKLAETVANSSVELTINDPVEVDANGKPIRMVRRSETNLGDLCADAYREQSGADIAIVNGGGIRVSIPAGEVTLQDILSVHPFGNTLCVIEISGQTLLDALEWGARSVPGECGGFPQVSGLTYEIHTYIDTPCSMDENEVFTGIKGERRVKNVLINGQPVDPEKTYTLADTATCFWSSATAFRCSPEQSFCRTA
ncbi:MAG: bifunctional metallophosphatase/5'-nucleotidase [Lachnospiraceae bacterium]|nr:bifunctional metallophosphatase/5'-nucleotidase [Lachnospiraceae bacterium]